MGLVRGVQSMLKLNQKDGFDCPGCAWPEPDGERSWVEFCENGVKAVAEEATTRKINAAFFEKYSVQELSEQSDYWLGQQGRLTEPMQLSEGATHYKPISWDQAFSQLGDTLKSLNDPNEAIFYTSGRTSNEAAFLYQLFVRLFGTNNLPDCSNMCHESSGVGLSETIGVGKGTVTLDDFDETDCILVAGQNPGTNHPRMLSVLQKAARRGVPIISVNPLPEAGLMRFRHPQEPWSFAGAGTKLAHLLLQVKINGDVPLFQALAKGLMECDENNVLDREFIQRYTSGFDVYRDHIQAQEWEELTSACGVPRDRLEKAVQILAKSKRLIVCWAMGLTQHQNAVANIQEIVNLLLLGGHLGRPGAGACPVRGHSNVQGDRTMGIWERPGAQFLASLGKAFDFDPPAEFGFDTVGAIEAMASGKAKVFFAMGGKFSVRITRYSIYRRSAWKMSFHCPHFDQAQSVSLDHGTSSTHITVLGENRAGLAGWGKARCVGGKLNGYCAFVSRFASSGLGHFTERSGNSLRPCESSPSGGTGCKSRLGCHERQL